MVGSAPRAHAGIAAGIQQTSLNVGGAFAAVSLVRRGAANKETSNGSRDRGDD